MNDRSENLSNFTEAVTGTPDAARAVHWAKGVDGEVNVARYVSHLLEDDGTTWEDDNGRTLDEICGDLGCESESRDNLTRMSFPDGSAVVEAVGGWDVEGNEPWSWAGVEE